jgi:proteasome lid subunit RPN8/RPN11
VHITTDVLAAMHAEAERHAGETGGIVVGPEPRHVTAFLPSGPAARRDRASYELDATYLQPLLAEAEGRGQRFLGVWHSHPRGFARLSEVDCDAARRILSDPDWAVTEILLPLSVRASAGFETEVFVARGSGPSIERASMVVCSGTHRPRASGDGPWAATGSVLSTPFGRARLRDDRDALAKAGFTIEVRQGDDVALLVRREAVETCFVLPREYPCSPPDVIVVRDGAEPRALSSAEVPVLAGWSSRRTLLELAEAVVAAAPASVRAQVLRVVPGPVEWAVAGLRQLHAIARWAP